MACYKQSCYITLRWLQCYENYISQQRSLGILGRLGKFLAIVMPISSTNQRLTRELYKPPPRSLIEMRLSQQQKFHSSGSIGIRTAAHGGLSREKHLDGTARKTAVVEPYDGKHNHNGKKMFTGRSGNSPDKTEAGKQIGILQPRWGNATCCGAPCCGAIFTRCNFLALLLGTLIGAAILGLVVGLTLFGEIQARDARIAELEKGYTDCFKDPCPSRSSYCTNSADEILCFCNDTTTSNPELSEAGDIDGYKCTFFNNTVNATTGSLS